MALFILVTGDTLIDVIDGSIEMPLRRRWTARMETGEDTRVTGRVRIQVQQGGSDFTATFEGTVSDGEPFEGRQPLIIVGGTGGLDGSADGTHYTSISSQVPVQDLVSDVVTAAGEVLAEGVYDALAGLTAQRWSRAADETWGQALERIAARFGLAWRVLDDGTIWVAPAETWPAAELDGQLLDTDTAARVMHVGFDIATARPGTIVQGRRISRVTFNADGHAELAYEAA